jgi:hypothetical protein
MVAAIVSASNKRGTATSEREKQTKVLEERNQAQEKAKIPRYDR